MRYYCTACQTFYKKTRRRFFTRRPRAYGYLCGFLGIALNLLLFAFKLFAGTVSGSIAVTADAFNNLSDAGSSIITLLGFKLAGKSPILPTLLATGGSNTFPDCLFRA